jgi:hypothetical protein
MPSPFGESLSLMQRMHPAEFPASLELHPHRERLRFARFSPLKALNHFFAPVHRLRTRTRFHGKHHLVNARD